MKMFDECFYKEKVKDITAYQDQEKHKNLQFSRNQNLKNSSMRIGNSQVHFTKNI